MYTALSASEVWMMCRKDCRRPTSENAYFPLLRSLTNGSMLIQPIAFPVLFENQWRPSSLGCWKICYLANSCGGDRGKTRNIMFDHPWYAIAAELCCGCSSSPRRDHHGLGKHVEEVRNTFILSLSWASLWSDKVWWEECVVEHSLNTQGSTQGQK